MTTAAIIPALNEYEKLRGVVEDVLPYVDTVIVVDDGSRTPLANHLPQHPHLHVLRHEVNLGKGAALKTGVEFALRRKIEAVVFLDADGQHLPQEIPHLLEPIKQERADIVFGVRSFHRQMPLVAKIGNTFLTKAMALLFHVSVADTQSGFRAFRLAVYPQLLWQSDRYSVETEIIVNTGKHHLRFTEVPITTIYLNRYRGTTVIDGFRIFVHMIAWRFL